MTCIIQYCYYYENIENVNIVERLCRYRVASSRYDNENRLTSDNTDNRTFRKCSAGRRALLCELCTCTYMVLVRSDERVGIHQRSEINLCLPGALDDPSVTARYARRRVERVFRWSGRRTVR